MTSAQASPAEAQSRSRRAAEALERMLRPSYASLRKVWVGAVFDRRYRVHTEDYVDLHRLGLDAPGRVNYAPSGRYVLAAVLRRRDVTDEDVFLDAGSGMGRVVLQAALRHPARRVIGVELSEELHRIAQQNLERNRHRVRAAEVELVNSDIREFEVPDDVTIVFLYNPFQGPILRDFADLLTASVDRNPRRLRVIYVNPEDEASIVANGRVSLTSRRRVGRWRVHHYNVLGSSRPSGPTDRRDPSGWA